MVIILIILSLLCFTAAQAQVVPTQAQVEWQQMEMNMFCHFGPNTFTGVEWGDGKEEASVFNPSQLDCRQWARTAKAAGFKGIVITAKHHDGFCLWPSQQSTHTVRESGFGRDVLAELSQACREEGLRFGVYISPWDRNHPTYGTPEYNTVFVNTLEEVHTQYGDIFEQWFDGACGEGPNGKKQVYDWPAFEGKVFEYHPNCIIFSDYGPGCRWVGNEEGKSWETCWSTVNITTDEKGQRSLNQAGDRDGQSWIPAETDVSIRPGWFWRASEQPKTLQQLLSIYYTSVGRNSLLLLNVPPDNRGLIDRADSLRLMEFRTALDSIFSHDVMKDMMQGKRVRFNRIVLQEEITHGQHVEEFEVRVWRGKEPRSWRKAGKPQVIYRGTTIGYKRILLVPQQEDVRMISVQVTKCKSHPEGEPAQVTIQLYQDNIYHNEN